MSKDPFRGRWFELDWPPGLSDVLFAPGAAGPVYRKLAFRLRTRPLTGEEQQLPDDKFFRLMAREVAKRRANFMELWEVEVNGIQGAELLHRDSEELDTPPYVIFRTLIARHDGTLYLASCGAEQAKLLEEVDAIDEILGSFRFQDAEEEANGEGLKFKRRLQKNVQVPPSHEMSHQKPDPEGRFAPWEPEKTGVLRGAPRRSPLDTLDQWIARTRPTDAPMKAGLESSSDSGDNGKPTLERWVAATTPGQGGEYGLSQEEKKKIQQRLDRFVGRQGKPTEHARAGAGEDEGKTAEDEEAARFSQRLARPGVSAGKSRLGKAGPEELKALLEQMLDVDAPPTPDRGGIVPKEADPDPRRVDIQEAGFSIIVPDGWELERGKEVYLRRKPYAIKVWAYQFALGFFMKKVERVRDHVKSDSSLFLEDEELTSLENDPVYYYRLRKRDGSRSWNAIYCQTDFNHLELTSPEGANLEEAIPDGRVVLKSIRALPLHERSCDLDVGWCQVEKLPKGWNRVHRDDTGGTWQRQLAEGPPVQVQLTTVDKAMEKPEELCDHAIKAMERPMSLTETKKARLKLEGGEPGYAFEVVGSISDKLPFHQQALFIPCKDKLRMVIVFGGDRDQVKDAFTMAYQGLVEGAGMKTVKVQGAMVDLPAELRGVATIHLLRGPRSDGMVTVTVAPLEEPLEEAVDAGLKTLSKEELEGLLEHEEKSLKEYRRKLLLVMLDTVAQGFLSPMVGLQGFVFDPPEKKQSSHRRLVGNGPQTLVRRKDGLLATFDEGGGRGSPDDPDERTEEISAVMKGDKPQLYRWAGGVVYSGSHIYVVNGVGSGEREAELRDEVVRVLATLEPKTDPDDLYLPFLDMFNKAEARSFVNVELDEALAEVGVVPFKKEKPPKGDEKAQARHEEATKKVKGSTRQALDRFVGGTEVPAPPPTPVDDEEEATIRRRLDRFVSGTEAASSEDGDSDPDDEESGNS